MKKFLAVFIGNPTAMAQWNAHDADERVRQSGLGIAAWHKWVEVNQASIVELGAPVGKTKRIGANGISDMSNNIGAYTVVQAQTHQAAAELFINHPHFTIFPGDSIEIMECMPIPGM